MADKHTLVRLALALLIVGSVVANPLGLAALDGADPTGDARAVSGGYTVECSVQDIMSANVMGCEFNNADEQIEDLQDHLSVYTTARSIKDQSLTLTNVFDNYILDSQDTGWLIANNETANAYLDGATKAETKTRVKQSVKQYYTVKQLNLINGWNNHVAAFDSLVNQSESVGSTTIGTDGQFNVVGWDAEYVNGDGTSGNLEYGGYKDVLNDVSTSKKNITLINGSTTMIREITLSVEAQSDSVTGDIIFNPVSGTRYENFVRSDSAYIDHMNYAKMGDINARPPNSDYSVFAFLYVDRWTDPANKLEQANQEIINESEIFVEQTWLDWEQGNINATDIIAQTNAMNRYQLDSTSDSATFNDVVAGLAASGLDTPPLNETGYLNVTFRPNDLNGNLTAQGMLLSTAPPPNGTWEVGKTYETANLSGAQTVIALGSSGDTQQYQVNRTAGILRINDVYDRDGNRENITELESVTRDYTVTNTTESQELIIDLGIWDKQLEERQASDGSGGGDSPSESNLWDQIIGALASGISALLGAVGLGGLLPNVGPVALVAIAGVVVVALRIVGSVLIP